MANYNGCARTNYFRVKDETAFLAWTKRWKLEVLNGLGESAGMFALLPGQNADDGTFYLYDRAIDDSLDICDEIAAHIADGSIAVVMEAGHQAERYVNGWAVAIDSKGERVEISLKDIYSAAAKKFGIQPTEAVA